MHFELSMLYAEARTRESNATCKPEQACHGGCAHYFLQGRSDSVDHSVLHVGFAYLTERCAHSLCAACVQHKTRREHADSNRVFLGLLHLFDSSLQDHRLDRIQESHRGWIADHGCGLSRFLPCGETPFFPILSRSSYYFG